MRLSLCSLAAVALLAGDPAAPRAAGTGPSFDCARAGSSAEEAVCAGPALAALDRQLADRFAAAVATLEAVDAGGAEALSDLRATQRGWIKGRDDCWKASDPTDCIRFSYQARDAELVAQYMLEEPITTTRWSCNGTPADAFYAMIFETALKAIRVERGDTVATGWQIPAASGARFALPFGRGVWFKGDEAILTWPAGTDHPCTRAE